MLSFCPSDAGMQLAAEHHALCRTYAAVQARWQASNSLQRAEIARLQAQVMQLRAAALVRTTQMAWLPDGGIQVPQPGPALASLRALALPGDNAPLQPPVPARLALLEASLQAAELVICQTGCLSHGAYWRDDGHCRRTGSACLLPTTPAGSTCLAQGALSPSF